MEFDFVIESCLKLQRQEGYVKSTWDWGCDPPDEDHASRPVLKVVRNVFLSTIFLFKFIQFIIIIIIIHH